LTDDESYEPSNEGNPERATRERNQELTVEEEGEPHGRINPLDYVSDSHPLLPPLRSRILDSAEALRNRVRYHSGFWWEVLLAMQDRAQPSQAQKDNASLRQEITRLNHEIDRLRQEKEQDTAPAEVARLTKEVVKLQKEREQDKAIIAYLESEQRRGAAPTPREEPDTVLPRESHDRARLPIIRKTTPRNTPDTLDHLHDNPKFPDAPVFSGDRATFESWKDKVHDKLVNSAAQYPTERHRIAYIRSRTDGIAYQHIRAQCQPEHPRTFLTAEDVLKALDKIYGDKNKRTRAINELRSLRMGRRPFDDFYADFARCAAEIGYSDDALVPLLENAISDDLARQVIGLQKPSDYYDLVDFYREIDHQIRDYDKRVSNRIKGPRLTPPTERFRPTRTIPATSPRPEGYIPTAEDRALLAQHGRCYKCGEHGHRIGDCTKQQMKEMPRLSARATNRVNKTTVDSDDDDTIVEGKGES
jgi:hypothetical protein